MSDSFGKRSSVRADASRRWMASTTLGGVAGVGERVAVDAGEGGEGEAQLGGAVAAHLALVAVLRCPSCRSPAGRSARCAPPARRPPARGARRSTSWASSMSALTSAAISAARAPVPFEAAGHRPQRLGPHGEALVGGEQPGPVEVAGGRRRDATPRAAASTPSATSRSITAASGHGTEVDAHRAARRS